MKGRRLLEIRHLNSSDAACCTSQAAAWFAECWLRSRRSNPYAGRGIDPRVRRRRTKDVRIAHDAQLRSANALDQWGVPLVKRARKARGEPGRRAFSATRDVGARRARDVATWLLARADSSRYFSATLTTSLTSRLPCAALLPIPTAWRAWPDSHAPDLCSQPVKRMKNARLNRASWSSVAPNLEAGGWCSSHPRNGAALRAAISRRYSGCLRRGKGVSIAA